MNISPNETKIENVNRNYYDIDSTLAHNAIIVLKSHSFNFRTEKKQLMLDTTRNRKSAVFSAKLRQEMLSKPKYLPFFLSIPCLVIGARGNGILYLIKLSYTKL